jgi:hypothetical protein
MAAHHQLVRCSSTSFLTCDGMRQMVPLYTGQKYLGGNPWRFFFYLAKLNKSTGPHIFSFSRSRSSGNEIRERATHTHTRRHYVLESVEPMLLYTAIQTHMGERERWDIILWVRCWLCPWGGPESPCVYVVALSSSSVRVTMICGRGNSLQLPVFLSIYAQYFPSATISHCGWTRLDNVPTIRP